MTSPASATTSANDQHETKETILDECALCLDLIVKERMIQPCDCCAIKWCLSCLEYDFTEAATRRESFKPPRCCHDIQLFKVLGCLDSETASTYRARFKEYIARNKTYCPAPACSAFIDADMLPNCESGCDRPYQCDFQCPHCGIRVCADGCRKIAHEGPCDMVAQMKDAGMMARLGVKQCPSCRRAIKRMYGCSNMLCMCGAYFCWYCCKPTENCDTDCEQRSENDEFRDDEREYNRDGSASEESNPNTDVNDDDKVQPLMDGGPNAEHENDVEHHTAADAGDAENSLEGEVHRDSVLSFDTAGERHQASNPDIADESASPPHSPTHTYPNDHPARSGIPEVRRAATRPIDLDAGGSRRWARAPENFGRDPGDAPHAQKWCCYHTPHWTTITWDSDERHRGDPNLMECNRCFSKVAPAYTEPMGTSSSPKAKRRKTSKSDDRPDQAYVCLECRLIVCLECKAKYNLELEDTPRRGGSRTA